MFYAPSTLQNYQSGSGNPYYRDVVPDRDTQAQPAVKPSPGTTSQPVQYPFTPPFNQYQIYPFQFAPPVNFQGSSYNFQMPNTAGMAAQYQQMLNPRFDALRDSRTSQLRSDFDFLRNKEMERMNQRGLIGSGIENQQMGRFNEEYSRQLTEIDKEMFAGQQKEAFALAQHQSELMFKTQMAAAENRLNTEIARAETALKSGQLSIAERELYVSRLRDLMNAQNELIKQQIAFMGTEQVAPTGSSGDGGAGSFGNIFGQALGGLGGGISGGGIGGAVNSAASGINSAGSYAKSVLSQPSNFFGYNNFAY